MSTAPPNENFNRCCNGDPKDVCKTSFISQQVSSDGESPDVMTAIFDKPAAAGGDGEDGTSRAEETPDDVPFSALATTRTFLITGLPLTFSALALFSLNTSIIAVIGRTLSVEEMGGASLALGLLNATGFAFSSGLCGALETVFSHVYGGYQRRMEEKATAASARSDSANDDNGGRGGNDDNLHIYGIYAQRMSVILLVVALPLGLVLCFADQFLSFLGESADVIYYMGVWCRVAMFGIPSAMQFQLLQRYYSCQRVTFPLSVAMLTAALVNPLLQYAFIKLFGFNGSSIAWLFLMTAIVSSLILYMWLSGLYKLTWGGYSKMSVRNLGSLISLAIPSMGVTLSEWVSLEVNALAAGFAAPHELAGFSITLQVLGMMFGMGTGVMILTCVLVGNEVGAGRPLVARKVAFFALGLVSCISVINVAIIYFLGRWIPFFFTDSMEVAEVYWKLMNIGLPYHLFDTLQSTVMGIFRGCELQRLGAVIITVALCVVGIPFSFLLFFHFDIGIHALLIGPFTGVALVGFPCYMYVLFRYIDWANLSPHETDAPDAPVAGADSTSAVSAVSSAVMADEGGSPPLCTPKSTEDTRIYPAT